MPDRSRRVLPPFLHRWALVGVLLLLAACAPVLRPAEPPRVALQETEIEAFADLLRLEDRREYDAALLERFSASPSPHVRRRAALALGRLQRPAGVPLLLDLLQDPDTAVAATAAFALGQVGDTAAVPSLSSVLNEKAARGRPTVAAEAAAALGKLKTEPARGALAALLRSTQDEELEKAAGAALLAVWKFPRTPDLQPIVRWTESSDPELRWRATYALVRRPDPAATEVLTGLVDDPDPRVRALAVRGLTAPLADSSEVGARATLPLVVASLDDPAYPVRINAARALGSYTDAAAARELASRLRSEDRHLALAAAESLGRIGAAASASAGELQALAQADSIPISLRAAALLSLAEISPRAAERVAESFAADTAWRARAAAGRALGALRSARDPSVLRLVRDSDGRVAAAALGAVVEAAGDSLAPLRPILLEALGSADVMVRAAALSALGRLEDPSTLPALLDAYARSEYDRQNDAALAAVDALGALRQAGVRSERAFFARFSRAADPLVRLYVQEAFGDSLSAAWGEPLPFETGRTAEEYRQIVRRWVAPVLRGEPRPRVQVETDTGTFMLELFSEGAPLTALNFLDLAEREYFEGQEWPRVVPNFVVQGGDPRGDTSGGPGYAIRDELNRYRYGRGTLGMALAGPDTGGSQFFITHSAQPHLDGTYTVFGEVVAGQEVTERVLPGDRLQIRLVP